MTCFREVEEMEGWNKARWKRKMRSAAGRSQQMNLYTFSVNDRCLFLRMSCLLQRSQQFSGRKGVSEKYRLSHSIVHISVSTNTLQHAGEQMGSPSFCVQRLNATRFKGLRLTPEIPTGEQLRLCTEQLQKGSGWGGTALLVNNLVQFVFLTMHVSTCITPSDSGSVIPLLLVVPTNLANLSD